MDRLLKVYIDNTNKENNKLVPKRQTEGSAGYDIKSAETTIIQPNERKLIDTGIRISIPYDTYGQIAPRSSLACKGIDVGAGIIDSDYRGLIKVLLINNGSEKFEIEYGDRIAQLIIKKIEYLPVYITNNISELSITERGDGGFGSTGIKN